ncbi:hypothetical protein ACWC4C_28465 [Streptomyces olivaceoviridis]
MTDAGEDGITVLGRFSDASRRTTQSRDRHEPGSGGGRPLSFDD